MDPRHPPQHPFSRNTASPYSHAPFQSTSSQQPPFPPAASHPPSAPPLYPPDHQRRPSDTQYYPQQPSYARDGAPMPTPGHSRHQSGSSIGHGTPVNRAMPPPSSPQQRHEREPQHPQHQHSSHAFPPPPPSRGPLPSLGTPMAFPPSRDLPSLSSIHRPGSSMSISSMLGGPPAASRESGPPASQYSAPPPPTVSAPPATSYNAPMQSSPQASSINPDYGRFRRPQTPEHQRPHEIQGPRDHRANSDPRAHSAGSPPRPVSLNTPEGHRYSNSTPQAYPGRNPPSAPVTSLDDRRDAYPVRVPNPNSVAPPPRPSSQPAAFSAPIGRVPENSRLGPEPSRPEPGYGRPMYSEREEVYRERARMEEEAIIRRDRERMEQERLARETRDRLERERLIDRERAERERVDRREPAAYAGPPGPVGHEGPQYGRQYTQPPAGPYNGPQDPRDTAPWMRARHEERASEQPPPQHSQSQPPSSAGYEYPRTTAQPYSSHTSYAPQESRYPPSTYGQSAPAQPRTAGPSQYDTPLQERQRIMVPEPQTQSVYQSPVSAGTYRHHESPRQRAAEEQQQFQQRGYLGVQPEINRKGRTSPFPQAVQGAQGQISGPGGEPGIKSEFGKMFSGIGSGVGGMGTPGATSNGAQTPFSNSGQLRREDLDGIMSQDSPTENGAHKLTRTGSRGGKRRNRLKEEDGKGDDDSSTGRRTPSGRGSKRPKNHHNQMGPSHRHSLNRTESSDLVTSPLQQNSTPFKPVGGPQVAQSPPSVENKIVIPHHHHINRHHHHHHHTGPHQHKPVPTPAALIIPKPKQIVRNQAVLDSVANLPRHHLGNAIYESKLTPGVPPSVKRKHHPDRGFASTPYPLPRFEGNENCTFTVKIPRTYLSPGSREEITSRRAIWGTDVYTDDSDIIAACIHGGWIRGEWPVDVDVSLLGLEILPEEADSTVNGGLNGNKKLVRKGKGKSGDANDEDIVFTEPPPRGPMIPLAHHDLHVTILILPALERYANSIRWGIGSREWKQKHDGLSFMILNIKWISGVDTAQKASGAARRLRMEVTPGEEEMLEENYFSGVKDRRSRGDGIRESNIRNDGSRGPIEIGGLGMGSWWKKEKQLVTVATEAGGSPPSTEMTKEITAE